MSQVIFLEKKSSIHRVIQKRFNSLSHIREKVESSESYWRISILRVVLKKKSSMSKKKVMFKKTSSIVWVVLKKIQFCESYSYFKKKKHFESHNEKRDQFFESFFCWWKMFWKEGSSLWVIKKSNYLIFFGEKTKSLSHVIKKGSILRVILKKSLSHIEKKKVQFFVSYFWWKFNSLSRFFWQNSKIQFFDSCSKKKKSILRVMLKKVQFIESCSNKSEFDSLSHTPKRGRFYSFSHAQKKTILWVTF